MSAPNFFTFSAGMVEGIREKSINACGATAFTRMPRFIADCESAFVKFTMAALVGA